MNGYNFTERVRKVLGMAREESARLDHEYVGTEHMLLALVKESEGVGFEVLRTFGVDTQAVADHVEKVIHRGRPSANSGRDLPYTSRAKMVLELSMKEAATMKHGYVGSEHLLLGMLAEGNGIAAQVLRDAGVTLDEARAAVVRILGTGPAQVRMPRDSRRRSSATTPVEHVEVIVHYRDGRRFQGSFTSPQDAIGFLSSAGGVNPG